MSNIIVEFTRRCMEVDRNPHCLCPIIASTLENLGFKAFIFSSQWANNFTELQGHFDQLHLETIVKDPAYLSDPIMKGALSSWTPIFWEAEQYCKSTQPFAKMFERALDVGYERGVAMRMSGRVGEVGILVAIYDGRHAPMDAERIILSSAMAVIGPYAALAWQGRGDPASVQRVRLSPRELECLGWSLQGKTAWETSRIISCSERTVNFHLQNAMRKLEAPSKQQAALKAMKMGLLPAWSEGGLPCSA